MDKIIQEFSSFRRHVLFGQQRIDEHLVRDGQKPSALIIARVESSVSPEQTTWSGSGDLFVCRHAGNMAPPSAQQSGGVSPAIAYAHAASAMAA